MASRTSLNGWLDSSGEIVGEEEKHLAEAMAFLDKMFPEPAQGDDRLLFSVEPVVEDEFEEDEFDLDDDFLDRVNGSCLVEGDIFDVSVADFSLRELVGVSPERIAQLARPLGAVALSGGQIYWPDLHTGAPLGLGTLQHVTIVED